MGYLEMVDAEDLRKAAVALHTKMIGARGSLFLLTGGAFLLMTSTRTDEIVSGSRQITDDDVFDTYAVWHEGVHMAQLVTSPFVFSLAFDMARLAQRAHRICAGIDDERDATGKMVRRYRSICSRLNDARGEYSPTDVMETHAVTQGLRWTMPENDGESLRLAANHFYKNTTPKYARMINRTCDAFDDDVGTILLPRLCFISFQAKDPVGHLQTLLTKLRNQGSAREVVAYTPRQLCDWACAPTSLLSRSLRERTDISDATGMRMRLTDHPWVALFERYFDDFEKLTDDERLDVLMGRQGGYAYPLFSPNFRVYPDGEVRIRGADHLDRSAIAIEARYRYIQVTSDMVSGLEFLQRKMDEYST
jgi:hypothetical protein